MNGDSTLLIEQNCRGKRFNVISYVNLVVRVSQGSVHNFILYLS